MTDNKDAEPGMLGSLHQRALRMRELGRYRCAEIATTTLNSFACFCSCEIPLRSLDAATLEAYEAWLRNRGLTRNSTSFYMRTLRAAYRNARCGEGPDPFVKVYTGVDKTRKRAATIEEIRRIRDASLGNRRTLCWARDMFMFSFYTRGMSFVDMAFLRPDNLRGGVLTYRRRKTQQLVSMEWTSEMQAVREAHPESEVWLLPILYSCGDPRRQYRNQLLRLNRALLEVGAIAGLGFRLTSYVSRHAWASIAQNLGVELPVISSCLGHDSEMTTRIYLTALERSREDAANRRVLDSL